jgi:hypothetical protein
VASPSARCEAPPPPSSGWSMRQRRVDVRRHEASPLVSGARQQRWLVAGRRAVTGERWAGDGGSGWRWRQRVGRLWRVSEKVGVCGCQRSHACSYSVNILQPGSSCHKLTLIYVGFNWPS